MNYLLFCLLFFSPLFSFMANIEVINQNADQFQDKQMDQKLLTKTSNDVSYTWTNITYNSARIDWKTTKPVNFIILTGDGFSGQITDSCINKTQGHYVINGLESNTTYSNWEFFVAYMDNTNEIVSIEDFTTLTAPVEIPIITDAYVDRITDSSVDFTWNINDPDNVSTSITLTGTDVDLDLGQNLSGTKTINGLTPNTEYNDWALNVKYVNEKGQEIVVLKDIKPFSTLVAPINPPKIQKTLIFNITDSSVDFDWIIFDPDKALTSIILIGTDVDLDLGQNLSGVKTVNGLKPNTKYNDWILEVKYLDGNNQSHMVSKDIDAFTTSKTPINPPE